MDFLAEEYTPLDKELSKDRLQVNTNAVTMVINAMRGDKPNNLQAAIAQYSAGMLLSTIKKNERNKKQMWVVGSG